MSTLKERFIAPDDPKLKKIADKCGQLNRPPNQIDENVCG
jgi:hypothetical protein